jgi:protein ImuB
MLGCLLIRSFPLACELADHAELAGSAAAVVGPERLLEAVSPEAEAYGVHPGQTATEAIGRCPALVVLEARPARYDAVWQDVLRAVERVVFTFEPAEPGLVRVAVDELLGFHRSLDAVMGVVLGCAPPALRPRMGAGPTRLSALLAARLAAPGRGEVVTEAGLHGFLAAQTVEALPVSADMLRRLRGLGLRSLGQLLALPRPALVAQFGAEGALAWDLAQGRDREPLRPPRRSLRLAERLSLETPLTSRHALLAAWEQTVSRVARQRGLRGLVARQAVLVGATERGRQWTRTVTFREPLDDSRRIWAALRPALDEVEFPGPLSELLVELRGLEPAVGQQLALPSARSAPERRLALIDFDP